MYIIGIAITLLTILARTSPIGGIWLERITGRACIEDGQALFVPDQAKIRQIQLDKRIILHPGTFRDWLMAQPDQARDGRFRVSGLLEVYRASQYLLVVRWDLITDANIPKQAQVLEPNLPDPLAIPQDIRQQIVGYQRQDQPSGAMAMEALVDQVGILVYNRARPYLVTTPLGLDAQARVLEILESSTLEAMEAMKARSQGDLRFSVSGLLIRSGSGVYLLPYKVCRQYPSDNLGL